MSAYIVSDKTITAIVEGMKRMECPCTLKLRNPRSNPEEIGQILINQNYASVNYRYDENDKPHQFEMKYKTDDKGCREDFTLGEMWGCVCCYLYQSCETPDFDKTEIYHAMESLKDDLVEKALFKLGEPTKWGI